MTEIDPVREVAQLPRAERVCRLFGREDYDPFDYQRDLLNHATISAVDLSGTGTSLVVTVDITAKDPSQ